MAHRGGFHRTIEASGASSLKRLEKRISGLEQQIQSKDRQIIEQNQELIKKAKSLDERERDVKALLRYVEKWDDFKEFMDSAGNTTLAIENQALKRDLETMKSKYENLLGKIKQRDEELEKARDEQVKSAESLRRVQASAFRFQDQPEWAPDSDDIIRRELNNLEREARAWCIGNSIKLLSGLGTIPDQLQADWQGVLRYDEKIFARNDQHLPHLILMAMLMDFVYGQIFARPLFFLPWRMAEEDGPNVAARGRELHEALARILEETSQANLEGAHAWRSQWLRLLDPRPRGDQKERPLLETTKRRTEAAREKAAQHIMQEFLNTSAAFLTSPSPVEGPSLAQLQRIFTGAAHLSYKLWLRKSYLVFHSKAQLPEAYHHALQIRAHSLHNQLLDDNEKALDGATIRVVTHPAVVVYGSSDGASYDSNRMWKEAVVYMG